MRNAISCWWLLLGDANAAGQIQGRMSGLVWLFLALTPLIFGCPGLFSEQPGPHVFKKTSLVEVHICSEQQGMVQGSCTSWATASQQKWGKETSLCCMPSYTEQDQLAHPLSPVNTAILSPDPRQCHRTAPSWAGQTCPQPTYCNRKLLAGLEKLHYVTPFR